MDKKTKTLLIIGAVGVGVYLLYRKARTKGDTILNKPELDAEGNVIELAEKVGASSADGTQYGNLPCQSPDDARCIAACEYQNGTFNAETRECWKDGAPISGGLFGSRNRVKR